MHAVVSTADLQRDTGLCNFIHQRSNSLVSNATAEAPRAPSLPPSRKMQRSGLLGVFLGMLGVSAVGLCSGAMSSPDDE
jgi:hypothetical protein